MPALYPPRVFPGCRILHVGNSRTFLDYMGTLGQLGQLKNLIELTWRNAGHVTYGTGATATGQRSVLAPGAYPSIATPNYPTVTMFNRGVSGSKIADLDANINTYLSSTQPHLVISWENTNDINNLVPPVTDKTVFVNTYQSVVNKCKAFSPTLPVVVVSDLTYGESYLTNPNRLNSTAPIPADIPANWSLNPECKAVADANPDVCTYADICTPYLAWLIAHYAPPGPGTGAATSDGLHENTQGAQLISQFLMPYLVIDP